MKLVELLNLVVIISWVQLLVKVRILRNTLDGDVTWLWNVLNKPGIDVGEINCIVPDFWREVLKIDILVLLQNILEQQVVVCP